MVDYQDRDELDEYRDRSSEEGRGGESRRRFGKDEYDYGDQQEGE